MGGTHAHHLPPEPRHPLPCPAVRHQHPRPGVLQHVRQALRRVRRVQGDVDAARLEGRQHGGHQLRTPLQAHPHTGLRPRPALPQHGCERVRAAVQLGVGQRLRTRDQGDGVGRPRRLLREQLVHAPVGGGEGAPGGAPLLEQETALLIPEQLHGGDAHGGVGGHGGQNPAVAAEHPLGRLRLPQLRPVRQRRREVVAVLLDRQAQVELGRLQGHAHPLRRHLSQAQLIAVGGGVGEHHPEERGPVQVALGVELLHQLLERHVLVRLRLQHPLAHPHQQLPERRRPGQVGADDQRVDEAADQLLHLAARPPRHRRPHAHVVLPRPAPQQRLPPGQERHEGRRSLLARQHAQRSGHLRRHLQGVVGGARGGPRRKGAVGGKLQRGGGAGQALAPVGHLALQPLAAQPGALPDRVVAVLHRQLREGGVTPFREAGVQPGDLAHQHAHAPRVADHVVHGEAEHPLALAQPQQRGAQERPPRQVEGARGLLAEAEAHLGLPLRLREAGQLHDRDRRRGGSQDLRDRALVRRVEDRAQRLVAAHHLAQRPLQGADVQGTAQPQRGRDVVGRAPGFQPVQEPEALLGEREGEDRGARVLLLPELLYQEPALVLHRERLRAPLVLRRPVRVRIAGRGRTLPQHALQEDAPLRRELRELLRGQAHGTGLRCP